MRSCIVTGASGFLGREVVPCLARTYHIQSVCHSRPQPGQTRLDLRDAAAWTRFLRETRPDAVVHLAAYRDPDFCEENREETWRLNVEPLRVLCDALPDDVPILFVSTDYVFDGRHPPYGEEEPVCPVNVYGESKVAAEAEVSGRDHSLILRVPLLIGSGGSLASSGFISQLVQTVRTHKPVLQDDVLVRFPTWTRDVAEVISFLLEKGMNGTFHYSGLRGGTRYDWMHECAEMLGEPSGHLDRTSEIVPRKAERPLNSQLSPGKIQAAGYARFTDFRDVVSRVLSELENAQ